jgi:hypothetical protein
MHGVRSHSDHTDVGTRKYRYPSAALTCSFKLPQEKPENNIIINCHTIEHFTWIRSAQKLLERAAEKPLNMIN